MVLLMDENESIDTPGLVEGYYARNLAYGQSSWRLFTPSLAGEAGAEYRRFGRLSQEDAQKVVDFLNNNRTDQDKLWFEYYL